MQINTLYSSGNGILDPKFYVKTDTGVFIRNFNLNIQQSGATAIQIPSNPFSIAGSGNSYLQMNIQNRASGTRATADLVITANNGTDTVNYINLGINNSGYSDPAFGNGSGLDGYLFINGGNLDIGTATVGRVVDFHIGGTTLANQVVRIDSSGINLTTGCSYRVNDIPLVNYVLNFNNITGESLSASPLYFGANASASTDRTNRLVGIANTGVARKATWTLTSAYAGSSSQNSTGYFINTTRSITGTISTLINPTANISNNYTGDITPPIVVAPGDLVTCALFNPTYVTYPNGVQNSVNVYFYT
jgi:hypothetical protein